MGGCCNFALTETTNNAKVLFFLKFQRSVMLRQLEIFPSSTCQTMTAQAMNPMGYKGPHAFHKYWGKKPLEPLAYLVENLCPPEGIVVDPFLGGGLLTRICRIANRRFIGIDVNPVSIELGKLFHDLPNSEDYAEAVRLISADVKSKIYSTYKCYDNSIATHYLWNDSELLSVWTNHNSTGRVENEPTDHDLQLSRKFHGYSPKYFREITTFSNSRINATPSLSFLDIFKPRACLNMDTLIERILEFDNLTVRRALLLTLTAASGQMSNFVFAINNRGKNSNSVNSSARTEVGSWAIGFWRPRKHFEVNVWNCFENRFRRLRKAIQTSSGKIDGQWVNNVNDFFNYDSGCALVTDAAQNVLNDIPDKSIDLVLTDPPHSDRIPYLELSDFWNSLLQFGHSNFEDEIIISNAQERFKTSDIYLQDMSKFILECARILKPNGFLCLMYNCRKNSDWAFLHNPDGLKFVGRFDLNYSAGSIAQDNRKGGMKIDFVLVFQQTKKIGHYSFLENLPNWSTDFPFG